MTASGLTLIIVGIFAAETLLVIGLRNHRKATYIMVFVVAAVLLIYKSQEFIRDKIAGNGVYPVEFSHISYFILGVTVVTGCKKMRAFASYCSMLAGLSFMVASIISSQSMINDAASSFSLGISVTQHMLLWLCGFALFLNIGHFEIKDIWIPVLGIALMVGFSYLVHLRIIYPDFNKWDDMVIIKIAEGTILSYVIPGEIGIGLRIFTVAGIAALVAITLVLFYKLNDKYYKYKLLRAYRAGVKYDATEIGIFPLIELIVRRLKRKNVGKKEATYNCYQLEEEFETSVKKEKVNKTV